MINHKYKCIFIHIPRTAGTSIEVGISGKPNNSCGFKHKHLIASCAKEKYREHWDDYFKFSFVRNPWARVVSMNRFPFYGVKIHDGKINIREYLEKFNEFELDPRGGFDLTKLGSPIPNSVYLNTLNEELDFIGKFENKERDYAWVCSQIGLQNTSLPLWRANVSALKKHYTEYYDDETRQIIAEKYAKDIETFGYEFGE